ncbi:hypothetical protein FOQG_05166 [Fusarium oxysporum f. sp. raphani 54005]|jgi:hypothetical protein|uniref:Uncharacterized protein n=9 Tax=Fusarium oxysporum species complex TaxID=171631 RepID=X0CEQ8_FUSOX|nr:hypothetical protein FOXG_20735 [Fusarium oxysporum f. sp. lycopersici 4287]XP_031063106.1 uncharacterized protein FOIG_07862 [Fusarium odoratissimum NRRL 54006]EXA39175.1 hypothetical protein FOVG_10804 [Fusarium oxysporum f. sp. pisi HDV247]EXK37860.1 hypothetical protein FOMG_08412 [Fusarium oxysporum f. sp. melonis 26406]EXK92910.1 hypothetical protein FOQG_05166 [Fusarium oxysporum f. sp. raphani 54005]EXL82815.1 hypothetical protein FOPG_04256 [Fusarium oxysporum f. sp. conglutinans r
MGFELQRALSCPYPKSGPAATDRPSGRPRKGRAVKRPESTGQLENKSTVVGNRSGSDSVAGG